MSKKETTTNTTTDLPVMRSLARVKHWPLNPRLEGSYRAIPALIEDLQLNGLDNPLDVWETPEADWVLRGNRRTFALHAMGWTECEQRVHHFDDAREALKFCLRDHGHTDPLDSSEKIQAVGTALKLGVSSEEVAQCLGVNAERVQLWFHLGEMMPAAAKRALAEGGLSMNTAEELLKVDSADLGAAVQMVLRDEATGEPMSHGQAVAFIQSKYLRPAQWRRDWLALEPKLKKRLKVIDGHHYVPWEERAEFVMGETGQPWDQYEFAEGYVPRDAMGRTWGAKAKDLSVTIYVVPAPRHEEKFVLLVSEKMVRAAESVCAGEASGKEEDESQTPPQVSESPSLPVSDSSALSDESAEIERFMRLCLGAIWEALAENPTKVMSNELWPALLPFLCHLTTDVDAGALEAWQGPLTAMQLLDKARSDKKQRAPLRWALLLLLCAESDAADKPLVTMTEMAVALGVNIKRLRNAGALRRGEANPKRAHP